MQMRESTIRETLEMYEKYKQGISIPSLTVLYGRTYKTIQLRFKKLGLKTFPRGHFNIIIQPEDMPRIIDMRRVGKSYSEIGKAYRVAADTVYQAFIRYNIPKEGRVLK